MLLFVPLCVVLHFCAAVCASRNRIRNPGQLSSASVWTYSNQSIVEVPTSTTSLSTDAPKISSVVDAQPDSATPATSPVAPASSKVTANATVISVTAPVSQPVTTSIRTPVYTPIVSQVDTSIYNEGNGTTNVPTTTPAAPPANQSNPTSDVSNQRYPTLTVISLSTPLYGANTGNLPIGTGTPVKPSNGSSNDTCGCTVNVRGAEIGYWYSLDQYYQTVTFYETSSGSQFSWGYVTATTAFDLVESVQGGLISYQVTSAWDPILNQTTIDVIAITEPMPAAATTTIMSRNEFLPIPTTPLTQRSLLDDLYTEPPPASVAFTGPSSTVFVAPSGTPYVAYSNYEVETFEPVTDAYGKVSCKSSVTTYNLSAPYAFEYNGDKLGVSAEATGQIPRDFLQQIPQSTCVAGSYQGPVTIIYIVHVIYGSKYTPFIGHVESSIDQLEIPTLIDGHTSSRQPKPHVETSVTDQPPALISTTRKASDSKTTAPAPAPGVSNDANKARPTQPNQNDGGDNNNKNDNGGGVPNLGAVISAVASQAASGGSPPSGVTESGSNSPNDGGDGIPNLGAVISAVVSQAAPAGNAPNGGSNPGSSDSGSSSGSSVPGSDPGSDSNTSGGTGSGSRPGSGSTSGSSSSDGDSDSRGEVPANSPPVIVAGTQTATMDSSTGFVIGGQTLSPGGPAIVVDGTVLSLSPSATAVVVNGQTSSLSGGQSSGSQQGIPELGKPPLITVGSVVYTANAATQYYLAPGQTLTAGGVATVDGTVVSLGPSASYVVIDDATQTFPSALITPAPNPAFAAGAAPALVIAGQTLRPGGSIVVSGTTVALNSGADNLIVDGVTWAVGSGVAGVGEPIITVAGTAYPAADGTSFIVGNQVLTPGGMIIVDGSTVSLDSSDRTVYINGVASSLGSSYPFSTASPALIIDGSTFVPEAVGSRIGYVINGQTLSPGDSITVDGTVISLAPGATALVVNGVTQALTPAIATNLNGIVVGGTTLSGLLGAGSTYVIDGQTLTVGGVITVDGTTISFPSETAVVINGVTQLLTGPGILTNAPDLTIGGTVYTDLPGPGTTYVIEGQTLTPGGVIIVDGTTISLRPSATALVVNGVTQTLFPATAAPGATRFPVLTIAGQTYTANPNSGTAGGTYVIDGQTLTPGGYIVVDGTKISLSPSATVLVVDGHTQTLVPASTTSAQASAESRTTAGAGATATQTAAATGTAATGAAAKMPSGAFPSYFLSGLLVLIGSFLL